VLRGMAVLRRTRTVETDEELIRALYDEHGPALLGYVRRLVGDTASAEDIVQETLLRAWRKSGSLNGDASSLRPWLYTVARNLAIDRHRAVGPAPSEGDEGLEDPNAAAELDRALETWQIAEALATLSADHREAIVETYYRGRSVGEAAGMLGVPPGTVKSRTYYGLRALRAALEERGWGG
jgi:RNA polymerase sigma-70 factor (ECF subfamily)